MSGAMEDPRCVYCGKELNKANKSKDHVPAKCFFLVPYPKQLPPPITVPCCIKCNNKASKDDDYLRQKIVLSKSVEGNPLVKEIQKRVFRGLKRPESTGYKMALLQSIMRVEFVTPSGVHAGQEIAYDVDLRRIHQTVSRYIRGLFYNRRGYHLPKNYAVVAEVVLGMDPRRKSLYEKNYAAVFASPPEGEWQGVFLFRVKFTESDPNTSAWLLRFYDSMDFIGTTIPKEKLDSIHGVN